MSIPLNCCLIQLLLLYRIGSSSQPNNVKSLYHIVPNNSNQTIKLLSVENDAPFQNCSKNDTNTVCRVTTKSTAEDSVHRIRRKALLKTNKKTRGFNITNVFWGDVWKSSDIKWVAKHVDSNNIRPSDRQFFHTLIPDTIFDLRDTCINLDQKDERDFTLLVNISWKDQEPSLRYPPVPPQCAFGRSNGFLCVLLDDGSSCHYVSGWGQDRVQALVDGRRSSCGRRQQLRMMLHALGLMHEHDRGDALQFVRLHPRLRLLARIGDQLEYRVPQDDCSLFRQNTSSLPFDFASMALYDGSFQSDSAQMDYELPLIPKRPGDMRELLAYHRTGLSHFDRLKLRYLYGCRSKNCPQAPSCENFGFRNKLCQCECAPGYAGKRCELVRKPPKDPCLQTVKHTSNFTLNATRCRPTSGQSFNFTIELVGGNSSRFAVTVDTTPARAVLEKLRLLPTCEHARLYFTGTGEARPQVVCAERLVLSPVTLRTAYSSGLLLLLLNLPAVPRDPGDPDPATTAIRSIHVDITSEPHPAIELQVDTTPPPPSPSTTSTSSEPPPEPPEPPPEPTPPPPPLPTPKPSIRPPRKAPMQALPSVDLGAAHRAAGSGTARAAVVLTVVILSVLVGTVIMILFLLRFRRDPVEEDFEMLDKAQAGQEGEQVELDSEGLQQQELMAAGGGN